MDGMVVGLFLLATFAGAVVTGLAGFAFGLVVASVWLHILTPTQTATLIIGYGVLVQSYWTWKLRHALNWRMFMPFVVGGTFGVPIGAALLAHADPVQVRAGVGLLLVLYSGYGLARPTLKPVPASLPVDLGIGFLNGLVGGMTGLAGVVVTMWCGLRGWPKDVQRAVFQPVILIAFVMSALWLGASGVVTADTVKLFLLGLPMVFLGSWLGLKLYGRLDDAGFRRVVLLLLLLSGLMLLASPLIR
jgi:uncharacterized membrane protein YfcA